MKLMLVPIYNYLALVPILFNRSSSFSTYSRLKFKKRVSYVKNMYMSDNNMRTGDGGNWRKISPKMKSENLQALLLNDERWSDLQLKESLDLYKEFVNCEDSYVAPLIKDALTHLNQALRLYGSRSVICSFNGGKDAVVIFHLLRAALANFCEIEGKDSPKLRPERPRVIYFDHEDEFPEVLELLKFSVYKYDLNMIAFEEGTGFSDGLKLLIDNNILPGTNHTIPLSFVLGTRASDPNAGDQGCFSPSSHYMPPFMRINPILNWNYGHVWHFLRLFKLPYCKLYDQGYTSLGTTKDTLPCPELEVAGSSRDVPRFWPAYMLQDWDLERAGRTKKKKQKVAYLPRSDSQKSLETNMSKITDLGASEKRNMRIPVNAANVASTSEEETTNTVEGYSFISDGVQRTVGLLIIGDEILKGLTADVNTQAAAKELRTQNVPLTKVAVVSDCPDSIVDEIKRLQREVDVVITSGGVGPTHDDVTIKSVSKALGQEMVFHEEMAKLLREKMNKGDQRKKSKVKEAQTKMATLPLNAKLKYISADKNEWPILQCQNIFILPGVPQYFAKNMRDLAQFLSSQLERSITYKVVLSLDETSIVSILNEAVKHHPNVNFGSYPFVGRPDFQTVLTLEGRLVDGSSTEVSFTKDEMDKNVKRALDDLIHKLEKYERGSVLRVDNDDGFFF